MTPFTIRHSGDAPGAFEIPPGRGLLVTEAQGRKLVMIYFPGSLIELQPCPKPCCVHIYPLTVELVHIDFDGMVRRGSNLDTIIGSILRSGKEPIRH